MIEPNGELPAHSLRMDVTFYVIQGKGQVTIDNQAYKVVKGDVALVLANSLRR